MNRLSEHIRTDRRSTARRTRALGACVVVGVLAAGCGGGDSDPVTFEPPGGGYSVVFPSEPVEVPIPLALPTSTVEPTGWMVEQNDQANITYRVDYAELLGDDYVAATDVDGLLMSIRDGSIDAVGGNLLENEEIELDGVPGLKFGYDFEQDGTFGYGISVVYVDDPIMYFAGGVGERDTADASEAFVDSFQFTDGATTSSEQEDEDS